MQSYVDLLIWVDTIALDALYGIWVQAACPRPSVNSNSSPNEDLIHNL